MELIVISLFAGLYVLSFLYFKYAIFLYVFFLPLRPLIDTRLFGLVPITDLFWLFVLFHFYNKGLIGDALKRVKYIKPLHALLLFTIVTIFIWFTTSIRAEILLQDYYARNISLVWVFFRLIQMCVHIIIFVVMLVIVMDYSPYRKLVTKAITGSALFVVFSMIFSPQLYLMGFNVREQVDFASLDVTRVAGLFSHGDVNSVATFLNIVIVLILINITIKKARISFFSGTLLFLLSLGVLITGSRMGFVTLAFIIAYYMFILQPLKGKFSISFLVNTSFIIMMLLLLAVFTERYDLIGYTFDRIQEQGLIEEITETGHRNIRWRGFINFTLSDISRTLWGSNDIYFAFRQGIYRAPHNFFIYTFYINGIFALIIFLWSFYRLWISFIKMKLLLFFLPLTVVVLISMMIIDSTVFANYYILSLGLIIYELNISERNSKKNTFANIHSISNSLKSF